MILSSGSRLQLRDPLGPKRRGPAREKEQTADDIQDAARAHIVQVLEKCGWKIKGPGNAAERLGLNPSTLRSRLKKLGISRAHTASEPAE